jgi:hypothetical protein
MRSTLHCGLATWLFAGIVAIRCHRRCCFRLPLSTDCRSSIWFGCHRLSIFHLVWLPRRETFPENVSISARLEGAEDLVNNLGGQSGQVSREDGDWRINGALLDVTAEDGIVLSLGGLGKDLVDFWEVVIISGSCHLVHVVSEVFSIAVREALLGSVSFKLKSLWSIAVEDSFEALDSSVEGSVGELRSPDSHAGQDLIGDAGGAGVECLTGGR